MTPGRLLTPRVVARAPLLKQALPSALRFPLLCVQPLRSWPFVVLR